MNKNNSKPDNPGVVIPPPFFYAVTFIAAIFIQSRIPINFGFFRSVIANALGIILLVSSLFFLIRSLKQFFGSKNTVMTIRPATSLQTSGIYNLTRNPMYTGLAIVYLGLSCLIGNWWNLILFPVLVLIVQKFIIKREEKYLERAFGKEYLEYKLKVRRWL